MSQDVTGDLVKAYAKKNSEDAARELFERYAERLIRFASQQMSEKLRRKVDPDDVVQSAFRSFFVKVKKGDYVVEQPGDFMKLLATLTFNKIRGQVQYYKAQQRDYRQEHGIPEEDVILKSEPSAQSVAIFIEELEWFMGEIKQKHRHILELYFQGNTYKAISERTSSTAARVGQIVREYREMLIKRCRGDLTK